MSIFIIHNDNDPNDPKGIIECHDVLAVNEWLSQRSKYLFDCGKKFNINDYIVIEGRLLTIVVTEVNTNSKINKDYYSILNQN